MKDPRALELLEKAYLFLGTSPVRYVVETSGAELRDDWDRKVFATYEEWLRSEARNRVTVAEILREEGVFPGGGTLPLEFSQWNYAGATHLLDRVIPAAERLIEGLEQVEDALAPWSEARGVVDSIIRTEESFLERARALAAERPKAAPQPAKVKGTSAARW